MNEYDKVVRSDLENILDLIGGTEPPYMDVSEFISVLQRKLSPEAKEAIKKFL